MEDAAHQFDFCSPESDRLRPESSAHAARRAYFMVREIQTRSKEFIRELSEKSTSSEAGHVDAQAAEKLLAFAMVQLAAYEAGSGNMPAWLVDFFFTALQILDQMIPEPSSVSLIQEMGALKTEAMLEHVCVRVSRSLHSNRSLTEKQFKRFVDAQSDTFKDLLVTALSLPLDVLRDLASLLEDRQV